MASAQRLVDRFDAHPNAIAFLRLAFALTVVVSHSWPLGGYGADPGRVDNNMGILAVEGFFALSGFLITRSAAGASSLGRFPWHRCLRIFPGFCVGLVGRELPRLLADHPSRRAGPALDTSRPR